MFAYGDDDFVTIRLPRGSHWMRYRVISEFIGFPRDIAGVVVDYLQILKLRDWIDPCDIDSKWIAANPDAFAADMIPCMSDADPSFLVQNPYAIDYIKQHADAFLRFGEKWSNPKIVEWLFSLGIYPETSEYLAETCSKQAVDKVLQMRAWDLNSAVYELSCNPMAIDLIRSNLNTADAIDMYEIWGNSAAVDILIDMISSGKEIDWHNLSRNQSDWALDTLRENQDKIDWEWFSTNPMIFEPAPNPNKKELLAILTGVDEVVTSSRVNEVVTSSRVNEVV